ncbi:MAG: molecular chaperone TorD family protein [Verrucomicrobiota bacterium]
MQSTEARRSVFGNYQPVCEQASEESAACGTVAALPAITSPESLQGSINTALARSFIYRHLAKVFEFPAITEWRLLGREDLRDAFRTAVRALVVNGQAPLIQRADELASALREEEFAAFESDYIAIFGHAARGSCPLNEIEYGDLKADPLFQPHRLADLAAFYAAFGLEMVEDGGERQDHICVELELMSVLTAKEADALEHQLDDGELAVCREAQRMFLREHLGRWTPAFTRRLSQTAGVGALGSLARFTREFIEADCRRAGVSPGSEDLLLRPADEAGESLCTSCGIRSLPPGALATPAQD